MTPEMMPEAIDLTTEEDIDRALTEAQSRPALVRALSAIYQPELDLLILQLDNGHRLVVPREEVQQLQNAVPSQLTRIEIHAGLDVAFPDLDVDLYLAHLLAGRLGNDNWMQSLKHRSIAA